MVSIQVDDSKCDGCGECVEVCPVEVWELVNGIANPARMEDCTECCSCVEVCPHDAIEHDSC